MPLMPLGLKCLYTDLALSREPAAATSQQTRLRASEDVKDTFARGRNGRYRFLKISLGHGTLVTGSCSQPSDSWGRIMTPLLHPSWRTTSVLHSTQVSLSECPGILAAWSPEHSHVHPEMWYAATRATLKKEFGATLKMKCLEQ